MNRILALGVLFLCAVVFVIAAGTYVFGNGFPHFVECIAFVAALLWAFDALLKPLDLG